MPKIIIVEDNGDIVQEYEFPDDSGADLQTILEELDFLREDDGCYRINY